MDFRKRSIWHGWLQESCTPPNLPSHFRNYSYPLSSTEDANRVTNTSSNHLECDGRTKRNSRTWTDSGGHTHATDDVSTLRTVVGNPNSAATGSKEETDTKLLNVTPAGGAIPDYWLYLSCWWISNNSSHSRSKNSHPCLPFAVFCFFEYLSASHRGTDPVVCTLNFLRLFPLKHLLRLWEGIDSPQGEGKCVTLRRLDW